MPELMSITLGDLLDQKANELPEHDALIYPLSKIRYSYSEFTNICNTIARGLIAMGIKKGDHVAIWATNCPEWIIIFFATAKIGAVLVTINTNYKAFELEYLLNHSDTTTLILIQGFKDSDYIEQINQLCPELRKNEAGKLRICKFPFLKNVVFIGENSYPGMYRWDDLLTIAKQVSEQERAAIQSSLNCQDVINMQYTSGTTGFPKGVMLTHYNLTNNGNAIADCMKFSNSDRLCIPVPLFHCFGCVLGVMACITKGATIVLIDYFQPLKVLEAIEKENCTAVHGVPTMFIALLEHPEFLKYQFPFIRTGIMAGSPCPIKVMQMVVDKMGIHEITIAYGQTEASPVVTQTRTEDPIDIRVTTVGRVLPHMKVKIIDVETGMDVVPGIQGEIITTGYQVMKGYYKMPEATAQAIDKKGWLHTGDLGTMDVNGYFKITGRLKDMIIRGGENIYPREIEEFLYTHPHIKDVQIVGVPDQKYGEEIVAFIILKDGLLIGENEIIQFVKNGLSRYKAPRYVLFINEYPMTASGKIQKYKLREIAIQKLNLEDAASIETA